ncbi:hypothetical protein FH972_022562 [Carpinus fangiana]|uniref:Conserved oligomeric Golgi complex subunit 5 n=1 Tax=Carpinus fangiana TaxID=176857 RepID=A0A5N6KSL5_9ROSI|nr:hypothetical protein FH972_022562 [Carpinus fangiana]
MADDDDASSYIDYETFLDPSFSAASFANTLVLATNDPSDTSLDLKTPLSRVLFDVQEVDTHIDTLTSQAALPLLSRTQGSVEAGGRILDEVEAQATTLAEGYERLSREVIDRHDAAEEVRRITDRLWHTVRIGRLVSRCLALGRQLESQVNESKQGNGQGRREDHKALLRGANTVLAIRETMLSDDLNIMKITVLRTLRSDLVDFSEKHFTSRAEQIIGQFSMSALSITGTETDAIASPTYAQSEDTKSRTMSALITLYLLSPVVTVPPRQLFEPSRLTNVLQEYLKRAITSSLAGLSNALAALPKLEKTLVEVSARCQNIAALEVLLESIKPPVHPLLPKPNLDEMINTNDEGRQGKQANAPKDLLQPLLTSLDTSSLPSYFWRTMASQLASRVQKIVRDGGVSARTLRSNRDRVRDALRDCVNRGSQLPASSLSRGKGLTVRNWEREAAVMTGALNGALGR